MLEFRKFNNTQGQNPTLQAVHHPLQSIRLPLQVILGEAEVKAGLKLAPVEKEVQVVDQPVSGVVFSQFRAKVSGGITCLGMSVQ